MYIYYVFSEERQILEDLPELWRKRITVSAVKYWTLWLFLQPSVQLEEKWKRENRFADSLTQGTKNDHPIAYNRVSHWVATQCSVGLGWALPPALASDWHQIGAPWAQMKNTPGLCRSPEEAGKSLSVYLQVHAESQCRKMRWVVALSATVSMSGGNLGTPNPVSSLNVPVDVSYIL